MNEQQLSAIRNYSDRTEDGVVWDEAEHPSPDRDNSFISLVTIESPFYSGYDLPQWRCRIEFGSLGVRCTMDGWNRKVHSAATALAYECLNGVGADGFGTLINDVHGAVGLLLYKWLTNDELKMLNTRFKE